MHMVDTEAKHALDKIMMGDNSPWNAKQRTAWARFVLSLQFRNPRVEAAKAIMREIWKAITDEMRSSYENRRGLTDSTPFEEFIFSAEPEPFKAALLLVQQVIENDEVGQVIMGMHWSRVLLVASRVEFLTSDRPLFMPLGLLSKTALIALPIGPKMLFVAGHDPTWEKVLSQSDPTSVVEAINAALVGQARRFVWGSDDVQHSFVEKQMGKIPEGPFFRDEVKQSDASKNPGRIGDGLIHSVRLKTEGLAWLGNLAFLILTSGCASSHRRATIWSG
jgi:Protein of unknown function (DUF4238)